MKGWNLPIQNRNQGWTLSVTARNNLVPFTNTGNTISWVTAIPLCHCFGFPALAVLLPCWKSPHLKTVHSIAVTSNIGLQVTTLLKVNPEQLHFIWLRFIFPKSVLKISPQRAWTSESGLNQNYVGISFSRPVHRNDFLWKSYNIEA